jgi:alpha-D-ribose 1-methylphosphonate 5-triphosphate diphosphatase
LLLAALRLPGEVEEYSLPAAIRTVSKTPADVVGLTDRGEIAAGKRADLIRVHQAGDAAAVRSVWCGGNRVA